MNLNKIYFLFYILFFNSIFAQKIEVLEHNSKVNVKELKGLNTRYRECNLSLMPNGNTLYFMSTRSRLGGKGMGDGDIYRVVKIGEEWGETEFVSQINTYSGEDEPSVSYDGEKIYFQSWKSGWEGTGGPYYEATIENGMLKNIRGLGGGINQFFRREYRANYRYATDGMAISPDGNLFIVACGRDYDGNMNLHYSIKKFGVWSFPKLLNVSTRGDERSVYIAADNQTVYFSSDGHGGFGGLDILKTTFNGITTGEVTNIGEPFNTSKDDMGFVISGMGEAAFFVRDLDIYYADLRTLNDSIKPNSSCLIFGRVTMNNSPLESTVIVKSNDKILGKAKTDSNGKYALFLPPLLGLTEVYVEERKDIRSQNISPNSTGRYREYELNFRAKERPNQVIPIEDSVIKKQNLIDKKEYSEDEIKPEAIIYFEFDKFNLISEEIEKLLHLLPFINQSSLIFINGHTDHVGSSEYNINLSRKRAEAVRDWIIEFTGLTTSQIDVRYKGESKTINSGSTPNERAMNRRVRIKVLNH
jgi:outer membrane protein OmpA-like peptidoglycan-associated protein